MTGYWRPSAWTKGGIPDRKRLSFCKKSETLKVADIITSLRGRMVPSSTSGLARCSTILLSIPMSTSVLTLLSWASSMTITEYFLNEISWETSRSRMPSVMNLMAVLEDVVLSNLI